MNPGDSEQISDCWSSEQQSATYYRTTAARARRLQEDATTPRVKQYFDKVIAHCEGLAVKVEPGVSPSRSARTTGGAFRRPDDRYRSVAEDGRLGSSQSYDRSLGCRQGSGTALREWR